MFRFKFDNGSKYDMVVYDRDSNTCCLYEVKHSDKDNPRQARHLDDSMKNAAMEQRYGRICGKYVLYRGKTKDIGDIHYQNVEEYLTTL